MSISPSLSYRSCAAAFPTGYGPRGDAFAVDHKWATSTLLIVTLKGNIDSGPTVAISTSYPLVHSICIDWYILMFMAHGWVC